MEKNGGWAAVLVLFVFAATCAFLFRWRKRGGAFGRTAGSVPPPAAGVNVADFAVLHRMLFDDTDATGEEHRRALSGGLGVAHESWVRLNPAFSTKYWSHRDAREFLGSAPFPPEYLETMDALAPYAYKADFARAVIAFHLGGFYADWKEECLVPHLLARLWRDGPREILVEDWRNPRSIVCGFFGAPPGSPFFQVLISDIILAVRRRDVGNSMIAVTGPEALGRVYAEYGFGSWSGERPSSSREGLLPGLLASWAPRQIEIVGKSEMHPEMGHVFVIGAEIVVRHRCAGWEDPSQTLPRGNDYRSMYPDEMYAPRPHGAADVVRLPRLFHKTSRHASPDVLPSCSWADVAAANPDFELKYHTDENCRKLIEENFEASVLAAYDALVPTTFKSDLWRYCLMHVHGGVYMDFPHAPTLPLARIFDLGLGIVQLTLDRPISASCGTILHPTAMAAAPGNPVFAEAIRLVVENVRREHYGEGPHSVTGGEVFKQALLNTRIPFRLVMHEEGGSLRLLSGERGVLTRPLEGEHVQGGVGSWSELTHAPQQTPYWEKWAQRRVYSGS